jgi:hypothetical protein
VPVTNADDAPVTTSADEESVTNVGETPVASIDEETVAGNDEGTIVAEPVASEQTVTSLDEATASGGELVVQDVAEITGATAEIPVDGEPAATDSVADRLATGLLVLQVEALDSTWVQVQWDDTDGDVETIPSGEQRSWTAQQFFMVRAGRAHGVHFRFQGELLGAGRLGDPTRVLRFHASADGVQLLGPDLEPIAPIAPIAQTLPETTEAIGQDRP